MPTRAEEFRATEERAAAQKNKKKADSKAPPPRAKAAESDPKHAMKNATYAFEEPAAGKRPSRTSTRKSGSRNKPDSSLTLREQLQKGSPEARHRRARDQAR